MKVGGLQKTSLQDYPDEVSSIIWTISCNFSCPFCYNKDLVEGNITEIPEEDILSFLEKRKKLIDGLVISGGEPLLQKDLKNFCKKVKKLSYKIKIDTNGSYPEKLKELIDEKLIDYIAMDIKAPKKKYNKLTNVKIDIKKIEKSIEIIKNSKLDYEFRTTIVPSLLMMKDIIEIAKWLKGAEKFYLQQFKMDTPLISYKLAKVSPYAKEELIKIVEDIKPCFDICEVRGT
jgi:pyruvate formate lyase activating enzyme